MSNTCFQRFEPERGFRPPRSAFYRAHLCRELRDARSAPAIIADAPTGYGKSILLSQLRREALSSGAAVIQFDGHGCENGGELMGRLVEAASHVADFRRLRFLRADESDARGVHRLEAFLSIWNGLDRPLIILIDDLDLHGCDDAAAIAARLCAEAPVRGQLVLAVRGGVPAALERSDGEIMLLGRRELAFTLSEAIHFLQQRLGETVGTKAIVRLYERCEGWPAALDRAAREARQSLDPTAAIMELGNAFGPLDRLMVDVADARLGPDVRDFLEHIAPLELLHPDLCNIVTGRDDAGVLLDLLRRETPLLAETEWKDCWRLHGLAHPILRDDAKKAHAAAAMPHLHRTAASWLAGRECWEQAADHALAAGDADKASAYIDRVLLEMIARGRWTELNRWITSGSSCRVTRNAQLARAICMTLFGHEEEAEICARRLPPNLKRQLTIYNRLLSAYSNDDPDAIRAADIYYPDLEKIMPRVEQVRRNFDIWKRSAEGHSPAAPTIADTWYSGATDMPDAIGLQCQSNGLIAAGQLRLAVKLLGPALERHDSQFGRRGKSSLILAFTAAAAHWGLDERDRVEDLLVGRKEMLEHMSGFPDAMRLGLFTMARMAEADGDLAGAVGILDRARSLAEVSGLVRLQIVAITELIRFHAINGIASECRTLLPFLDRLMGRDSPVPDTYRRSLSGCVALAHARTAIAEGDFKAAATCLEAIRHERIPLAASVETNLVAAGLDMRRTGEAPALHGLIKLAMSLGCVRLLVEADPMLHPVLIQQAGAIAGEFRSRLDAAIRRQEADAPKASPDAPSLTSRELDVLHLLKSGLPNKEIARTLDIGAETVKWHIKKLTVKLETGGRRGIVNRSRTLGLLESAR